MVHRTPLLKRPVVRLIVIWAIEALALVFMAWLLEGLSIDRGATAIIAAAVIGLLNALLWPLLSYIILPLPSHVGAGSFNPQWRHYHACLGTGAGI